MRDQVRLTQREAMGSLTVRVRLPLLFSIRTRAALALWRLGACVGGVAIDVEFVTAASVPTTPQGSSPTGAQL